MDRLRVVVFTGAGVSAESGVRTFRDGDGLWENHRMEDVATPEAWDRDPELVLRFYNERRRQLDTVEPNAAHRAIAALEQLHEVEVVTQNVDDLHERAGSTRVLHLHGELRKARSTTHAEWVVPWATADIRLGDRCPRGGQLRPHIVWFGEEVPQYGDAVEIARKADMFLVVGTSLVVYPAAGLVHEAPVASRKYWVDPQAHPIPGVRNLIVIREKAGAAVPRLAMEWGLRD
jgi:NAD-dependent deacetylase